MKAQFDYDFFSEYVFIDEPIHIKFDAEVDMVPRESTLVKNNISMDGTIDILIDNVPPSRQKRKHTGCIHITLPGRAEKFAPMADYLASSVATLLSFHYGQIDLQAGVRFAKNIPETDKEKKEIGDKPYYASMSIQEVPKGQPIKKDVLQLLLNYNKVERVMSMYVYAKMAINPLDEYLGFYKVIEALFFDRQGKAKNILKENRDFTEILKNNLVFKSNPSKEEIRDKLIPGIIDDLINIRDECSHLKEKQQFGYSPVDPEVYEKVKPMTKIINAIAKSAINEKLKIK